MRLELASIVFIRQAADKSRQKSKRRTQDAGRNSIRREEGLLAGSLEFRRRRSERSEWLGEERVECHGKNMNDSVR